MSRYVRYLAVAAATLATAAPASARVDLTSVDASAFPTIQPRVVSSAGASDVPVLTRTVSRWSGSRRRISDARRPSCSRSTTHGRCAASRSPRQRLRPATSSPQAPRRPDRRPRVRAPAAHAEHALVGDDRRRHRPPRSRRGGTAGHRALRHDRLRGGPSARQPAGRPRADRAHRRPRRLERRHAATRDRRRARRERRHLPIGWRDAASTRSRSGSWPPRPAAATTPQPRPTHSRASTARSQSGSAIRCAAPHVRHVGTAGRPAPDRGLGGEGRLGQRFPIFFKGFVMYAIHRYPFLTKAVQRSMNLSKANELKTTLVANLGCY